jgi:hypothetical protein
MKIYKVSASDHGPVEWCSNKAAATKEKNTFKKRFKDNLATIEIKDIQTSKAGILEFLNTECS